MKDPLGDLLGDAVSDIEPTESYAAIRARTSRPTARRSWAYAGGALLSVAAVITVVAVLAGGRSAPVLPAPAASPTAGPASTQTDPTDGPAGEPALQAVYYVGDTPAGPRLYREFRTTATGDDVVEALMAAPRDPDYRTMWPAGSLVAAHREGDTIVVELGETRVPDPGVTTAEARLAVQQVSYTVQAAYQVRAPVRFVSRGAQVDQVYGVDTSAPVAALPQLDVLSHMSISDPAEGNSYAGSFTARGVANGYEGTVSCSLTATAEVGGQVVWNGSTISGWQEPRLLPWTLDVDLTGVAPGRYTFACQTEDPSGRGGTFTDTRGVVVE